MGIGVLIVIILVIVAIVGVGVYFIMSADKPVSSGGNWGTTPSLYTPPYTPSYTPPTSITPSVGTPVSAPPPPPPSAAPSDPWVIFYEGDSGKQSSWNATFGSYSHKRKGNYTLLPFPNDEARSVRIPSGIVVYVTDKDSFQDSNASLKWGPGFHNFCKSAGKVSSVAIWKAGSNPPRGVPLGIKNLVNVLVTQGQIKRWV